jgi:hypothetical protein
MDTLISGVRTFDLFVTRNPRAYAAHSGLHTKPWQNPAVEGDPDREESDNQKDISHW